MTNEAAINHGKKQLEIFGGEHREFIEVAIKALEQEPKTGQWILPQWDDGMSDPIYYQVRCSECGFDLDPQTFGEELKKYGADRFCPKCGAKMVEPQESEEQA